MNESMIKLNMLVKLDEGISDNYRVDISDMMHLQFYKQKENGLSNLIEIFTERQGMLEKQKLEAKRERDRIIADKKSKENGKQKDKL